MTCVVGLRTMDLTSRNDVLKSLESLYDTMGVLVSKRNALIHAHPITDMNGDQIFNYQGRLSKPIPDKRWRPDEVRAFITEVDEAACHAGELLSKLPPGVTNPGSWGRATARVASVRSSWKGRVVRAHS